MRVDNIKDVPEGKSDIYMLKSLLDRLVSGDSDDLALRLLDRFGSVAGIFKATPEELFRGQNISERVAAFFTFAQSAYRQALLRSSVRVMDSECAAARFATAFFMDVRQSGDYCVFLDRRYRIISAEPTDMSLKDTVGKACRIHARKLIVIGCKPFATMLRPTLERLYEIKQILEPAAALGLELVDYIEYGGFMLYSMRRALGGQDFALPVDVTDETEYTQFDFTSTLPEHIKQREHEKSSYCIENK